MKNDSQIFCKYFKMNGITLSSIKKLTRWYFELYFFAGYDEKITMLA